MHDVANTVRSTSTKTAEEIVASPAFHQLMRQKNGFILPAILFSMVFYFTLPVLTSYATFLNEKAIGDISWAWMFAFAQFIMTWTFCILYSKRAKRFDELVERIKEETR